jgi:hypothetical protein
MLIVELTFHATNSTIISEPLNATKEEFLRAVEEDESIDFPIKLKDDLGFGVFAVSTHQIQTNCFLVLREVE